MSKDYGVSAIIGDLLERYFILDGVERNAVEYLCFSCVDQGICVHLPFYEPQGGWCLRLTSEMTAQLLPKISYYDLTAKLIDGNTVTLIRNATFTVRRKENYLCEG